MSTTDAGSLRSSAQHPASADPGLDRDPGGEQGPEEIDLWPGSDVRHSKEDALSDRQFERMYEATFRMDGDYHALESRMILFAAGRLGMRSGEICHLKEEWIDWRENMIRIPKHDRCTDGRDGGICGSCRQAAKQIVEHNDGVTLEQAESIMWRPKTEYAAREIPINVTARAAIVIEDYFERFDQFESSQTTINRRVDTTAEIAREVDPETTYPHALRATAGSYFAARNLGVVALKAFMGWKDFDVAIRYLQESGERTATALRDIQN